MARHNKGKSKRRIKNWHSRFVAGEDIESKASSRQKFSAKGVKLGDGSFGQGQAEELQGREIVEGMVTGVFRRGSWIRPADGGDDLFCGIAKTFRAPDGFENSTPLAVGDNVSVALTSDDHTDGQTHLDRNRMDGMILSRNHRETVLARPMPRSQKRRETYDDDTFVKVIVSNMDTLLIVAATAKPRISPRMIERFLIVAQRGELEPILALNKIDVAPADEELIADIESLGVRTLQCSATEGQGLDELRELLTNRKSVLAGASGVGKSTLINALLPHANAPTRTVRSKDNRGRHTTSQARVYDLECGGILVDTPGIRELGVDLKAEELPWYFPEIEAVAPSCKFRNCTHTHEPKCAVREAVEQEIILPRRFESYLRILDTLTAG